METWEEDHDSHHSDSRPNSRTSGNPSPSSDSEVGVDPDGDDSPLLRFRDIRFMPSGAGKLEFKVMNVEYWAAGGEKTVFRTQDGSKVLCIFKDFPSLDEECRKLNKLRKKEIPAVAYLEVGRADSDTREMAPAGIMDFYPGHSKIFVRMTKKHPVPQSFSTQNAEILTRNSIGSLQAIQSKLDSAHIAVGDLQFLIDHRGYFFISDPSEVIGETHKRYAQTKLRNTEMIKELISVIQIHENRGYTSSSSEASPLHMIWTEAKVHEVLQAALQITGTKAQRNFIKNKLEEFQPQLIREFFERPDNVTQYGVFKPMIDQFLASL